MRDHKLIDTEFLSCRCRRFPDHLITKVLVCNTVITAGLKVYGSCMGKSSKPLCLLTRIFTQTVLVIFMTSFPLHAYYMGDRWGPARRADALKQRTVRRPRNYAAPRNADVGYRQVRRGSARGRHLTVAEAFSQLSALRFWLEPPLDSFGWGWWPPQTVPFSQHCSKALSIWQQVFFFLNGTAKEIKSSQFSNAKSFGRDIYLLPSLEGK